MNFSSFHAMGGGLSGTFDSDGAGAAGCALAFVT